MPLRSKARAFGWHSPTGDDRETAWCEYTNPDGPEAADRIEALESALTDARNNILSLLGGFRDDMPDAAVKLFQAQARQIDATLNRSHGV